MTGPDHYRQAEALLGTLHHWEAGSDTEKSHLAEAQVHATLALAAAHLAGVLMHPDDRAEWDRAAGRIEAAR